jgi:hypothetical protein
MGRGATGNRVTEPRCRLRGAFFLAAWLTALRSPMLALPAIPGARLGTGAGPLGPPVTADSRSYLAGRGTSRSTAAVR